MSDEDVVIDPEALARDAEEIWEAASNALLAMKAGVPELSPSDFGGVHSPPSVAEAYSCVRTALGDYLCGGSDEMLFFERNLLEAAIDYGSSHGMSAAEIDALRKEIEH